MDHQGRAKNSLSYLLSPLLLAGFLCLVYLILLGGKINFVSLLASQQGEAIKTAGQVGQTNEGRWQDTTSMLTVVLWWSFFRANQFRLPRSGKMIFFSVFSVCVAIDVITCVATVSRNRLMPLIAGLFVIHLFHRTHRKRVRLTALLLAGAASTVGSMGTFLALSYLRGALGTKLLVAGLLGYTIVSYNRMAALLCGVMHYAYEGRGVYLSRFLLGDPKINSVFHLIDRFDWPNSFALWQSEFSSTFAAGLNPGFIWSGAFGYLYSDLGWWTPLYTCGIGALTGYFWKQFKAGTTAGIVLYPWTAYCVLTWFGTNEVLSVAFIEFVEAAVVLSIYDRFFLRSARGFTEIGPEPILGARSLPAWQPSFGETTTQC